MRYQPCRPLAGFLVNVSVPLAGEAMPTEMIWLPDNTSPALLPQVNLIADLATTTGRAPITHGFTTPPTGVDIPWAPGSISRADEISELARGRDVHPHLIATGSFSPSRIRATGWGCRRVR